ncbi:MAG: S-adenosylmethionine synthetase, partial [Nitrospirota bacterium]
TERLVLAVEHHLNEEGFKKEFPETGEDVKVMAVRQGHELLLTVAMPFLSHRIRSEKAYFQLKAKVLKALKSFIGHQPHGCKEFTVALNTLDRPKQGLRGMYLTLLGTSAEQGDSGQVGRGNRACGVISLNRPMSGEAAAGKNPVSHVGKIYNVLAHEMANRVYHQVQGIEEVTIWLVSTIGQKVNQPMVAAAQVALKKGKSLHRISSDIETIIQEHLDDIGTFCSDLAKGEYPVC